jgi:methionyl-tRNA formyltransferase
LKNLDHSRKILFLGSEDSAICDRLKKTYSVLVWHAPLDSSNPFIGECDLAVSFGYRHILKPKILERFKQPVINLHISYLPWNRGADPNFWSFLEKTPSGVSIHQIDQGIDTGAIYAQSEVQHDLEKETLASSYGKLTNEIEGLFFTILPNILSQKINPKKQGPGGSFHKIKDKNPYLKLLHSGWNTPLRDVWGAAC